MNIDFETSNDLREKMVADIWIRWIIASFLIVFAGILTYLGYFENIRFLLILFFVLMLYNSLCTIALKRKSILLICVYLCVLLDISAVSLAIYFTRGMDSPLFLLYLFIIFIEAFYLRFMTCLFTFFAALIGFLLVAFQTAPLVPGTDHWLHFAEKSFVLVLTGVVSIIYASKIQERTKRLKDVVNNVGDIIIIGDHHEKCSFVNAQGLALLGYRSVEMHQRHLNSLFFEPGRFAEFYKSVSKNSRHSTSLSIISKSGEKIPILWRGMPYITDRKKPKNVLLIGRDLRDSTCIQEEVEKKTDEETRLYEIIAYEIASITSSDIQISDMMNRTIDVVFKALHADACSIMLLNEKNKDLHVVAGRGVHTNATSEFRLPIGVGVAGWVAAKGERLNIADVEEEKRFFHHPGLKQKLRSLLCMPLIFGPKVLGVINVSREEIMPFTEAESETLTIIASRAALSIENKNIVQQLEDEKIMLDRILNTAGEAILCLDSEKKVFFINDKGISLLEYTSEELFGKKFCKEIANVRNQKGKLICNADCILDKACMSDNKTASGEAIVQTKSGKQIWSELHYSAITDHEGKLNYGVLSIRDISERKRAERMRVQLTSNIVHELRTPLTYMRGYVDLLLMGRMGPLTGEQTNSISIVRDSIFRLVSLIDNLLEVARMEEGKFYLNFTPVSLQNLLSKIVNLAKAEGARKNIEITLHHTEQLPIIYADEKRLSEIFINLLSNALKFTPSGGKVDVECNTHEEVIVVCVKDTGVGISDDYKQKIFSRFSQIGEYEVGKPGEGAGLGLNIVKRITEAHGGEVWVESEPGKGAAFYVRIPKRSTSLDSKKSL